MDKGTFTPPQVVDIEGVLIKAIVIADRGLVEIVVREAGSGQLKTMISNVKALGLSSIVRGCNVLAVCESRIAGVTQYVNELRTVTTHERTGLSLSRIINLDVDDDFDFSMVSAPSEEPAPPAPPSPPATNAPSEEQE